MESLFKGGIILAHPFESRDLTGIFMSYRLFIDDLRDPASPGWVVARDSDTAIKILEAHGCPAEISFDHDLGGIDTAMRVVRRPVGLDLDAGETYILSGFQFSVHSANSVGRENIQALLDRYLAYRVEEHDRVSWTVACRPELTFTCSRW